MKTLKGPPPAGHDRKETILLRLEACTDREGWHLSQLDGQALPTMPKTFKAPSEAVNYAKEQCDAIGRRFVIRADKRQMSSAA